MTDRTTKIADKIIWISYLALVTITPLIFSTHNSELFEVPKMLFVYLAATIIFFATLIKFVLIGKFILPKNLVLITFLIFAAIQVASTLFSIDKFTSIFGYPSRLNGGLLSQLAYFTLFTCALVNLSARQARILIIAIVLGSLSVSLWGIPAHFGKDPSCQVITGKLNSACWQKEFDPTLRIFSTLGQPNWLASYLVLVIPASFALALSSKNSRLKVFFAATTLTIFLALIFTNSRAGFAGQIISLITFGLFLGTKFIKSNLKTFVFSLIIILTLSLLFGKTLVSRFYESITQNLPTTNYQLPTTQTGGTESGQIRFIVWRGAIDAFKARPILGFGPETFAYSYYLYRPLAHNLTTEWNFFYNKAHNEFLNYAANSGLLGILGYFGFLTAAVTSLARISSRSSSQKQSILIKSTIAAIVGYQVTIFFGFSTVTTQLLMYLMIPLALILEDAQNFKILKFPSFPKEAVYILSSITLILGLWLVTLVTQIFISDIYSAKGEYKKAIDFSPTKNPFYLSEFAYESALYLEEITSEEEKAALAREIDNKIQRSIEISPNNIINTRRIANTYLLLSNFDPNYQKQALNFARRIPELAPTDPQSYYSLAKIQAGLDLNDQAKKSLEEALGLKADYVEAKELFEQLTIDN